MWSSRRTRGPELIWRSPNAAQPMNLSSASEDFPLRIRRVKTNEQDLEAQREEKKR